MPSEPSLDTPPPGLITTGAPTSAETTSSPGEVGAAVAWTDSPKVEVEREAGDYGDASMPAASRLMAE